MARAGIWLVHALFAVALTVVGVAARAADFETGFSAYASGDYATALHEWTPLAEAGNVDAQFGLGLMYQTGRGVEGDFGQAAAWFRRAAEQGSARAQYSLGDMYARGEGVDQDWSQALGWWRKAAGQGNARAQFSLGMTYLEGIGVAPDPAVSKAWLTEAAEQGYSLARAMLKEMIRQGRDQTVAEASPPENIEPEPPSQTAAGEPSVAPAPKSATPGTAVVLPLVIPEPAPAEAMAQEVAVGEEVVADDVPPTTESPDIAGEVVEDVPSPAAVEPVAVVEDAVPSDAPAPPEVGEAGSPAMAEVTAALAAAYKIHLASFRSRETALFEWRRLIKAHGDLLDGLAVTIERVDLGTDKGVYFRVYAGPFTGADAAKGLCRKLGKRDLRCRVIPPT